MINKQGFQKIEQNKIMTMVMIIVTYSQLWWRWWCWQPVHDPRVLPCPPWQTRWGGVVSQDMNCLADYDYFELIIYIYSKNTPWMMDNPQ